MNELPTKQTRSVLPAKKRASLCTSNGEDKVYTPDDLALAIVNHFAPLGSMLEPCAGGGAFLRAFDAYNQATAQKGLSPSLHTIHSMDTEPEAGSGIRKADFLTDELEIPHYDWIMTNLPWSLFTKFLKRGVIVADNLVFLDKWNAWGFNGRVNILEAAGFVFQRVALIDPVPKPFPSMGMQLSAVHIRRARGAPAGYFGTPHISRLDWKPARIAKYMPPPPSL